jgi:Domain of unknown function (DUF4386)
MKKDTTISAIDETQRKAARVAGLTLLFAMALVMIGYYGITTRLIVQGNASETARNIIAHEDLFRINIACNLIYAINVMALLTALYVIFKPINRYLASIAALFRLVYAVMWVVTILNMLGALRLLGDTSYLGVFNTDQLQTLSRLNLVESFDSYYAGLPFWGLASTVCSYLWLKSRYIPRALATFGLVSSGWCVICAFAFIAFPNFDKAVDLSLFDLPLALFEMVLGVWLLVKGLRPSGIAVLDK